MIKTAIILGLDGNFPIWYKNDGFAKSENVAKWIFEYCGWQSEKSFPELVICEETIEATELNKVSPCDKIKLFVLGNYLLMN